MVRVLRQRTRRVAIEGLGIEQRFDQPFFVQIDHRPGDTAEAEAGGNAVTAHFIFKEASYCQRGAAGTGLQRETLFKVTGVLNDFRRLAGDQQLARVLVRRMAPAVIFCGSPTSSTWTIRST